MFRSRSLASHFGQMLCSSESANIVIACSPSMAQKLAGIGTGTSAVGTSGAGRLSSGTGAGTVLMGVGAGAAAFSVSGMGTSMGLGSKWYAGTGACVGYERRVGIRAGLGAGTG